MGIKKIKVRINKKKIIKDLDTDLSLTKIRKLLLDDITFPFIFLNEDEEEIQKDKESHIKLEDILDGKNLYLQKEIIIRKMLGEKVETKNGLDFYIYPQRELTEIEKRRSSNIMVFGETGCGKSAWLHCFLNYLQGIQIEENNRYFLFNEKKQCSTINTPAIYNIESTNAFTNPIRLIDTQGFDDLEDFDTKIIKDIQDLFTKDIETLNAICLIFKANCRIYYKAPRMVNKLFSLFGNEIKKNVVLIFTFVDDINDITALKSLKYH